MRNNFFRDFSNRFLQICLAERMKRNKRYYLLLKKFIQFFLFSDSTCLITPRIIVCMSPFCLQFLVATAHFIRWNCPEIVRVWFQLGWIIITRFCGCRIVKGGSKGLVIVSYGVLLFSHAKWANIVCWTKVGLPTTWQRTGRDLLPMVLLFYQTASPVNVCGI